ncbi:MAG: DUF3822 family protein [Flavobacteriales bacterium]|tara:strand:+ start:602 stop:1438 length:837 start_codon:yes stop_codon:yes gene_type:complete
MEIGENNNITSFYKKNVNFANTENFHLSIEVSPTKLKYTLLNTENLEYLLFKSVEVGNNLLTAIGSEEILKQTFFSTSMCYSNFPTTIVPNELYSEINKERYLQFISDKKGTIKTDKIHQNNATTIYSVKEDIVHLMNQIQSGVIEKNSSTIIIEQLIKQYKNLTEKTAFLFINRKNIELIILKKGELILHNYFDVNNSIDVLYYTLFGFNQLKMNPEESNLYLFGNIEKGDENYILIYDYIRNIKFGSLSNSLSFNEELKRVSQHQNFSLFSQILCV